MYRFSQAEMAGQLEKVEGLHGRLTGTIHVNHDGCPAGVDTKARLYITPTDRGDVALFYCHHCQGRGGYHLPRYKYPHKERGFVDGKFAHMPDGRVEDITPSGRLRIEALTKWYEATDLFKPPADYTGVHDTWTNSHIFRALEDVWGTFQLRDCYGMRIKQHDRYVAAGGDVVVDDWYKIYLPVFEDGTLTGLWIRMHPKGICKVLVYGAAKKILFDTEGKQRHLVVVEDPISAIKLDCLGVPAYSLGGLDMTVGEVIKLRTLYDRIVVWLDNDKASDKVVDTIVRTLQLAGHSKVLTVRSAPEPKKCSAERIREELHLLKIPCRV